MSRTASRKRRKGGALGVFVVALIGGVGALLHACRADRWLDDLATGTDEGKSRPRSTTTATGAPSAPGPKGGPARGGGGKPADASVHLALGIPTDDDPSDDHLMRKPQYALSYNADQNVANWVSWQIDASWFGDAPRHKGKFMTDPELPSGIYRVTHDDYTGSGYDRGHMVRSEERTRSPEDNKVTFLMTNILPQYHDLNAGPWLRLEEHCENLGRKQGKQLFVMAGGILKRGKKATKTIGKGVAVPDTFFKIVVVLDPREGPGDVTESTPVIAVLMPNKEGIMDEGWEKYRTTVDEIERRTGYDFLTAVDEDVQAEIEAKKGD
ncbi:DNA/RNA non-specific endonuclease [Polyangium sp. y55x31]|uniref:DNA/RNA non-specific endonuclease n=1 Tax=Polyangium sp. y55x31 TaxID=3042688 RepID=UPI0024825D04|nr:DNA/RNA non-specific endonuclease [Polyangium sp. y55x31]MDI1480251.1 DNA/RNA non-specific endonuclease [Polyangium sp. y55x31]